MGFLVFLILSFGAFGITCGSKCVPETAKCSRHWVKIEPHKNLMESERELNSWCRKQALFYRCLEKVLLGKNGNLSDLPTNLLISKMFSEDLCLQGSNSRKRYLDNAACINQLDTEYCTLPEYLDIVTPDDAIPPSRCSLSEKTFSCIVATTVVNCGFDAGRVYRYLLKVTTYSEEVCDVESSEGIPPCEDPKSNHPQREEELSEIFYGLVHRFGVIPEQENKQDDYSVFSRRTTASAEDGIDENAISDAIRNALDSIEEDSLSEEYDNISGPQRAENLDVTTTERYSETVGQYESFKKNPIITEPFKGLLHYNYSGQEFSVYWRQPNDFPVENVECEHLLPSYLKGVIFRCVLYRRLRDPDCIASVEYDEQITPIMIRDIDPDVPHDSITDFGPSPYWMTELNEYKRQKELREQIMPSRFSESISPETSDAGSVTEGQIPAACTSETRIHDMVHDPDFKWWKCPNVFTEELRKEIISVLLPDLTDDDIPLMSAFHANNVGYVYLYEPRFHEFESINCSRVNECHPKGRGVFKCSIRPRAIKKCENCYEESQYPSRAFDNLRNIKTSPTDSTPSSEETYTNLMDGSGDKEDETSSEKLIAMLLSEGESPISEEKDPYLYNKDIGEEDDELVAIDISTVAPGEPETEESSNLRFVFLHQDPKKEADDVSDIISDLVYTTDEVMNDQGNNAAFGLSSGDEYKLLHENVFVLQAVPPINDVDATYEIIDSEEETDASTDASKGQ